MRPGAPRVLGPFAQPVMCLAISENETLLAIGTDCGRGYATLAVEALVEGIRVPASPRPRIDYPVSAVAWNGDELLVRTGTEFLIWNSVTGESRSEPENFGPGLAICRAVNAIITANNGGVTIRDFQSTPPFPTPTRALPPPRGSVIGQIARSDDGAILAAAVEGGVEVRASRAAREFYSGKGLEGLRLTTVALDRTGRQLAAIADDRIYLWTRPNPRLTACIRVGENIESLRFASDGKSILLLTRSGIRRCCTLAPEAGADLIVPFDADGPVRRVDPQVAYAVVQGSDSIKLRSLEEHEREIADLPGINGRVLGLVVSRDLATLAIIASSSQLPLGGADQIIVIANENGRWSPRRTVNTPVPFDVDMVALSDDGSLLAAGTSHSAWLWDLSLAACAPGELLNHPSCTLADLAFSGDGMLLLTAGHQCGVELWPTHRGLQSYLHSRVVRSLTREECRRFQIEPPPEPAKPEAPPRPPIAPRADRQQILLRQVSMETRAYLASAAVIRRDRARANLLVAQIVDELVAAPDRPDAHVAAEARQVFSIVSTNIVRGGGGREQLTELCQAIVEPVVARLPADTAGITNLRTLRGQIDLLFEAPEHLGELVKDLPLEQQVGTFLNAAKLARELELSSVALALWEEAKRRDERLLERQRVSERLTDADARWYTTDHSYVLTMFGEGPEGEDHLKLMLGRFTRTLDQNSSTRIGLVARYAEALARRGDWTAATQAMVDVDAVRFQVHWDRVRLAYIENLSEREEDDLERAERMVREITTPYYGIPARVALCVAYHQRGAEDAGTRCIRELFEYANAALPSGLTSQQVVQHRERQARSTSTMLVSRYAKAGLLGRAQALLAETLAEAPADYLLGGAALTAIGDIASRIPSDSAEVWIRSLPPQIRAYAEARFAVANAIATLPGTGNRGQR